MEQTNRGKAFFFSFLLFFVGDGIIQQSLQLPINQLSSSQLNCTVFGMKPQPQRASCQWTRQTSRLYLRWSASASALLNAAPADAAVFAVSKYPTVTAREEQRQSNYCSGRCRCVWAATASLFSKCFLSFWRVACNQGAENVHLQKIKLILVVPCACLAPLLIFSACAEAFLWLLVLVCVELPCKGATDGIWLWLTTLHCDVFDY